MIGRKASRTRTRTTMAPARATPNPQWCRTPAPTRTQFISGIVSCDKSRQYCGMAYDTSLAGDEQPVLLLHPHWKTLIPPLLLAVVVVAAALVGEVVIPSGSAAAAERLAVGGLAVLAPM